VRGGAPASCGERPQVSSVPWAVLLDAGPARQDRGPAPVPLPRLRLAVGPDPAMDAEGRRRFGLSTRARRSGPRLTRALRRQPARALVEQCSSGGAVQLWWSNAALVEQCSSGGATRRRPKGVPVALLQQSRHLRAPKRLWWSKAA